MSIADHIHIKNSTSSFDPASLLIVGNSI